MQISTRDYFLADVYSKLKEAYRSIFGGTSFVQVQSRENRTLGIRIKAYISC